MNILLENCGLFNDEIKNENDDSRSWMKQNHSSLKIMMIFKSWSGGLIENHGIWSQKKIALKSSLLDEKKNPSPLFLFHKNIFGE